jgi:hypothetical protein
MTINDTNERDLAKVTEFITTLLPLFGPRSTDCSYNHVGAVLADVALQAGVNYETVVRPRITRILTNYSQFMTTSLLVHLLTRISVRDFLSWQHKEKVQRFRDLMMLVVRQEIQTVDDLGSWLTLLSAEKDLLSLRGIGPKSVDYMKILCGHETCAIDRHLKKAIEMAGVYTSSYEYMRWLLQQASRIVGISPRYLDTVLWNVMRSY